MVVAGGRGRPVARAELDGPAGQDRPCLVRVLVIPASDAAAVVAVDHPGLHSVQT